MPQDQNVENSSWHGRSGRDGVNFGDENWSPSAHHEGVWRIGGVTPFIRYLGARWAERPHSLPKAVWMGAEKSSPGIEPLASALGMMVRQQ